MAVIEMREMKREEKKNQIQITTLTRVNREPHNSEMCVYIKEKKSTLLCNAMMATEKQTILVRIRIRFHMFFSLMMTACASNHHFK